MKSEELLRHIGSVKDKYIEELMSEPARPVRRRADNRRLIASIAACLAVIMLGTSIMAANGVDVETGKMTLSGGITSLTMAQNSVIMIDVNPSIRLEVNDRGVVVKAEALNEDAQNVMAELELCGKDYTAAVTVVVGALQEKQYITDLKNSILVSVTDTNEETAEALRENAVNAVVEFNKSVDYSFSVLSQIIKPDESLSDIAGEYGVSEGRIEMINKLISEHSNYSFDELIKCNIQTINQLFEYIGLPDTIQRIGEAAGVVPSEYREKLKLDELNCEELLSFTSAISDFYDKLSEYYSESDVAKRIGYEFNIIESSTEDGQKLWAVLAESLTRNIGDHAAIINIGQSVVSDWFNQSNIHQISQYLKTRYYQLLNNRYSFLIIAHT